MLKIAMAGAWHVHARGYAKTINEQPDACVSCVWDDDTARGSAWAKELGVPFYSDFDALLSEADCGAVCICSATSMHKELMIKCAKAKKHIFTEKVMCLTSADCDEAADAIRKSGIVFTISFPHRCFPQNLFIKQTLESGILGDITLFRVRNTHNGSLAGWLPEYWYDPETTGGGAMMDLGAHPMYLSDWFMGKPVSIQSSFKNVTSHAVEDDAISVMRFENGATAIAETSLVSPYTPRICEVYGTKGVILCEDDNARIKTDALKSSGNGGWISPALPPALPEPLRQFIDSVLYNKPVRFGLDEARALTVLMENAYKAHREKREIMIEK